MHLCDGCGLTYELRIPWEVYHRSLFPQLIGDIDYHTLQALLTVAVIEQGGFQQPAGLVMEQALPPFCRDKFRKDYRGELAVLVFHVGPIQVIKQGLD